MNFTIKDVENSNHTELAYIVNNATDKRIAYIAFSKISELESKLKFDAYRLILSENSGDWKINSNTINNPTKNIISDIINMFMENE